MRTQIHALTHTNVHISTLHMCIHFASIAQMVKFKPVGLLKWLRHYKECSNTHWMQYTLSCAGPTLHKCCNGAHFQNDNRCWHFHNMFHPLWFFEKYFPQKHVFRFSHRLEASDKNLTPLICEVVGMNHTAVPHTPPPYNIFSSNHRIQTLKHNPHKCIQALSPSRFPSPLHLSAWSQQILCSLIPTV